LSLAYLTLVSVLAGLGDGQDLTIAERPPPGREVIGHKHDLTEKRFGHGVLVLWHSNLTWSMPQ
jgi:hypothetical protein